MLLNTSCQAMTGGVAAANAVGEDHRYTFGATWQPGDKYTVTLSDSTDSFTTQVGAGTVSGIQPNFALTYANKVYVLAGSSVYFSAVNLPSTWNDPNASGNGFVSMSNWYAAPESLLAIAPYQGRLVFFSSETAQIWQVASDPTQWQQVQVLQNTGTNAPLTVQPVGDLDVMFQAPTGIRSLRVRDSSLNAYVDDIGSPIDLLTVPAMISAGTATTALASGVVEPTSNRYWVHLNGTIYVLSYFRSAKVSAWSTYLPTNKVAGVQTTFVPLKFVVFQGQVYVLATQSGNTILLVYGGSDNNTYDGAPCTVTIPFLDAKEPATEKDFVGIDVAITGTWLLQSAPDIDNDSVYTDIATPTKSTFDDGKIDFTAHGTHISIRAKNTQAQRAVLSQMAVHYKKGPGKDQ